MAIINEAKAGKTIFCSHDIINKILFPFVIEFARNPFYIGGVVSHRKPQCTAINLPLMENKMAKRAAKSTPAADASTYMELLQQWHLLKERIAAQCAPLIAQEMELRKALFASAFPAPKEGTNTVDLLNGWKLKAVYKLDRKIDADALPSIVKELGKQGVSLDSLVQYDPKLITANYKTLNDTAKAIFDSVLTTKPASPTLELVAPKTQPVA